MKENKMILSLKIMIMYVIGFNLLGFIFFFGVGFTCVFSGYFVEIAFMAFISLLTDIVLFEIIWSFCISLIVLIFKYDNLILIGMVEFKKFRNGL